MQDESSGTCKMDKTETCLRPLEGIIDTISKKWTLQVVAQIGNNKKMRYGEILTKLKGISSKSLADRLKELEGEKLIKREFFAEIPPRVEYSLTEDGEKLRTSIIPLMTWVSSRTRNHETVKLE